MAHRRHTAPVVGAGARARARWRGAGNENGTTTRAPTAHPMRALARACARRHVRKLDHLSRGLRGLASFAHSTTWKHRLNPISNKDAAAPPPPTSLCVHGPSCADPKHPQIGCLGLQVAPHLFRTLRQARARVAVFQLPWPLPEVGSDDVSGARGEAMAARSVQVIGSLVECGRVRGARPRHGCRS